MARSRLRVLEGGALPPEPLASDPMEYQSLSSNPHRRESQRMRTRDGLILVARGAGILAAERACDLALREKDVAWSTAAPT